MNSIFPDEASAAGIVYRNADGTCLLPVPDIVNADCPTTSFKSTCDLTALPSNCDARIEPRQINAIVSELLNFAACVDPNGTWDCNSLKNLCTAFAAWTSATTAGIIISDTPPAAADNMMWWESDSGNLFVHYNDGNSTQWVQIAGSPAMDGISIAGLGVKSDPHFVSLVDCGEYA